MNKTSIVSKVKFATTALFFAALLSTGSTAIAADNTTPVKETANAKGFNVKYVEPNEDGYIFSVKYDNLAGTNFDLIIKDETGETLYQRSFKDKNFSKKFQISNTLIKAVFVIRPSNADEQAVEAAIQSRTTQDVVISRL
ncbi:MAG: hypothetical protein EOP45_21005 [Sphingobacteriaceae bacterium]|nr:MAG: hypothetical protein EOP45_21005 [Sphingobacteriaceae bacterium]